MPGRAPPQAGARVPGPKGLGGAAILGAADAPTIEPRTRPGRPPGAGLSSAMRAHLERFELGMPKHHRNPPVFSTLWFLAAFVIPVVLGALYFFLLASNQYVSEFHFTVRQPLPETQPASLTPDQGNDFVGIVGRTASGSGTGDTLDNYTVVDYITSDAAAHDLDQRLNLRAVYTHSGADFLARYNGGKGAERLASYWRKMVWATYDPATGLASVKVRAFSPQDAYAMATNLIDLSNGVVNSIGQRSRGDSLHVAQQEVDAARARMAEVRNRMTALRGKIGAVDPTKDQETGDASLATTLNTQLAQQEAQLDFLSKQLSNANAPQIARAKAEIAATEQQIAAVGARVVGGRTGGGALTSAVGEYEQLDAERQAAEKMLFDSLERQQAATVDSDSQRLYLATYVNPTAPDNSTYPKRLQSVGMLALYCLLIWAIGMLVGKSVLDHIR
jgi:capsular polysaccharide transport system permease protein